MSREKAEVLSPRTRAAPLDEPSVAALCTGLAEAIFTVDLESGCIVYWNSGADALFKYRAEEILRENADKLFSDESSFDELYRVAVPEIQAKGYWRGEWEYRSRGGSPIVAEATATLLTSARGSSMTVVLREGGRKGIEKLIRRLNQRLARRVTERTSELISQSHALAWIEAERGQTEQLLEALLRNLNNYAVVILSPEGDVLHVNDRIERVLGYSSAEIERVHLSDLCWVKAGDEKKWDDVFQQVQIHDSFSYDDWLLRKDGSRIYARVELLALRDGTDGDALTGYLMLLRDDTEERKIKERLKNKEHMAAIGTATAMLAHEIKNPLNGMSTTVQLLERALRNDSQPSREIMMGTARDLKSEIGRLQSLLADFQAISHPQRLALQSVDLAQLMRELVPLVVPPCSKQKIEIVEEYAAELPAVEADPDKLKQAFIHLFKNACEAMPNGGTLTSRARLGSDGVCVEIADTGGGIPEGLDIFELFSSTKAEGTGLGMAIVRQIILAHDGSIDYTSTPGVGTTFRVSLPLCAGAPATGKNFCAER